MKISPCPAPASHRCTAICTITAESIAARAFLDEEHAGPRQVAQHDNNSYILGKIGSHNVVIAALPDSQYGTTSAATVARDVLYSFPNVRIRLIVGIRGSAPNQKHNIRLGNIVVNSSGNGNSGVFQYDFSKTIQNSKFQETGFLNQPPALLRTALTTLKGMYKIKGHQLVDNVNKNLEKIKKRSKYSSAHDCDIEYSKDTAYLIARQKQDEEDDDPAIHYGLIASGNQLIKDARTRDALAAERDVLYFKIEAAGLMNHFPYLDLKLGKPDDLSVARNPHFLVPFPSDPDFVNRSNIWTWIQEQYAGPTSRFALVGLGGFGVFWVHGSTKATFEESYRSIADVLALLRRHDPDVDILVLLGRCGEANRKRQDDPPSPDDGKSTSTTTSPKKLGQDIDKAAAVRLVGTLEYIPLAINQAAAYINKRNPRVTIQSYMDEFQQSENRKGTLLYSDRGDIRRYEGVSNSVVVTWQVTFEQIKREQPRAANLLSLMSYFHAQNIPDYMLHDYNSGSIYSEEGSDEYKGTSDIDFEDDLDPLLDKEPSEEHNRLDWSKLMTNVSWYLVMLGNYSRAEVIVQQAVSILTEILGQEHPDTLTSMNNLASTYRNQGRWKEAEKLNVRVMETRKRVLGEEHPSTLASMNNLASTFWNQGRWKKAEELEVRVMETRKTVLGEDHPNTLTSMHNLAFTWKDLEQWEDGMQLLQDCVRRRENVLGVDHLDTMSSASALLGWELEVMENRYNVP
ncbi:kinesin light [Colletotrichum musicola]|uniref:Kinesin light n=1 Tax=Colletotrichum musicola TaxID=2175873 RepID=A0A8H6MZ67_9PEZI|nr:kinesin light [Colletotrichum musicola]